MRLDLSAVDFCDSAGLAALIRLPRAAESGATDLRVVSNRRLDRLLQITGVESLVTRTQ